MTANCDGCVVVTGVGKAGLVGQKLVATLASTGTINNDGTITNHFFIDNHGTIDNFKRKMRSVNALLIDDVQFLLESRRSF